MRERKVGGITLGLALVAIGGSLLYTQLTGIGLNWPRLWPLLLIMLGIEVLWTGMRAGPDRRVRISFSAVLLLLLVIALSAGSVGAPFAGFGRSGCVGPLPSMVSHREVRGDLTIDWSDVSAVHVVTVFGSVTLAAIGPNQDAAPPARVEVTGQGPDDASARQAAAAAGVLVNRSGSLLTLTAYGERASAANSSARVDITLAIPADIEVRTTTEHGATSIEGFAGPVTVGSRYGRITIREIGGPVDVQTEHGSVTISHCAGSAEVTSSYGAVDLLRVVGAINVDSRHGKVSVTDAGDEVAVETTYGNISVRYSSPIAADCRLASRHGQVLVEIPRASAFAVDAESQRSRITTNFPGIAVVTQGSGSVLEGHVNGGEEPLLRVRTDYSRLDLRTH